MLNKVLPILEEYVKPDDTVIAGISGGPDSMALLDTLVKFSKRIPCTLLIAHVNHGLRGKASNLDEKLVLDMTKKYGCAVELKKLSLSKTHIEVRAREERRKFFEYLKEKYGAKWIITAHHLDDNIESIFLHFLRGSGPAGLAGMQIAKDSYFRPFLKVSKKEILSYVKRQKIPYRIDKTNKKNTFRRNLLRNKIFPLLKKINPHFEKTILRNAEIFRDIDAWLSKEAKQFLAKNPESLFSAKEFLQLPKMTQKTVLQLAFRKFTNQPYRLSSVKISEILRMIERNIGKKKILLGKHGAFLLEKGRVRIHA